MQNKLMHPGFLSLIATQFFGAMKVDNVLKGILTFMVIDGAWAGHLGSGGQGIVGICFAVLALYSCQPLLGSWLTATQACNTLG